MKNVASASDSDEIKFNGKSIPLKTEKIKQIFNKVTTQVADIKNTPESKQKIGKVDEAIILFRNVPYAAKHLR